MKKLLFWKKMLCSGNMVLCRLAKCCDAIIFALAAKFHLKPHDVVRSSITCIKHSFWFYFSKLVQSLLCVFVSFRVRHCVCFIFVHAAFVRIKLMMMMTAGAATAAHEQARPETARRTG